MIRIQVDSVGGDRAEVTGGGARHLLRVLRLRVGDVVQAFDGRGAERPMRLAEVRPGSVVLAPAGDAVSRSTAAFELVVLQALAKGDKLPRVVRAVTELGASRIGLVATRRAVSRPPDERAAALAQRLSRIAAEASRQSGRADVPEVAGPSPLAFWLAAPLPALRVAAWEGERRLLAEALPPDPPAGAAVLVGPEGGFDQAEVEQIRAAGWATVSLGPRILRTETVAPALCAILQFRYGGLGPPSSGI